MLSLRLKTSTNDLARRFTTWDLKKLIPFGKKNLDVRQDDENPFAMMQREMNRIFDSFSRNWGSSAFPEVTGPFTPRMDVSEDAKAFTVTAELPGMSEKDIDLLIAERNDIREIHTVHLLDGLRS